MARGVAGTARTAEEQRVANRANTRAWLNSIDEETGLKKYAEARSRTVRSYLSYLLSKARSRKADCTITVDELMEVYEAQAGLCALSGVEMTRLLGTGDRVNTNMSLDRIDSSKGYVPGNVQIVCALVNIMKQSMSNEELVMWCKRIVDGVDGTN